MDNRLNHFKELTLGIEGWFSKLSIALFDVLLSYQSSKSIQGNLMEIGAWHGKSAAMLAVHASRSETVFIFDIEVRKELSENISRFSKVLDTSIKLSKANSFTKITPSFCSEQYRKMRWVHVDGDHSAYGVYNDLELANSVLHPHGVLVVDDFLNERFPQVSEVTYEYVSSHKYELCLLLVGGNKGYFVRPKFRDFYFFHLDNSLASELLERGIKVEIFSGTSNGYPCLGVRQK